MFFVERDHMIEDFTATRSHPSLGNSVLPRCLYARLLGFQTRRLQKGDHIGVVSRIAIEDCVTIPTSLGEGFTQLVWAKNLILLKTRVFGRPVELRGDNVNGAM